MTAGSIASDAAAVPVRVNGTEIPQSAIDQEVQYHPATSLEQARMEATQALVVREVLWQEAVRQGFLDPGDTPDEAAVERAFNSLLQHEIQLPEPDESVCRRWFEKNPDKFRTPDTFEAAHILFPAPADDETARAGAKAQAEETLALLQQQPERFAELAASRSACPSKANGGQLGTLSRGQTVPEFETFLYSVLPGTVCTTPVPTRFGFHVLRVDSRQDGAMVPFEQAQERIADYLRESAWRRGIHQYIQILLKDATIEGFSMPQMASPLVQ